MSRAPHGRSGLKIASDFRLVGRMRPAVGRGKGWPSLPAPAAPDTGVTLKTNPTAPPQCPPRAVASRQRSRISGGRRRLAAEIPDIFIPLSRNDVRNDDGGDCFTCAGATRRGLMRFLVLWRTLLPFVLRAVAGACVGRRTGQPRMPPQERLHEGFWFFVWGIVSHAYAVLCVIVFLVRQILPDSRWPSRLREMLLMKFPQIPTRNLSEMGFPQKWESSAFWRE